MSKKRDGFSIACDADNLITQVTLIENGEAIASEQFDVREMMESPVWYLYLVKSVWPLVGARKSQESGLEKLQGARETWDLWVAGEWAAPKQTVVRTLAARVEAIMKVAKCDSKTAKASLNALTEAEQDELFVDGTVYAAALKEVEATRKEAEVIDLTAFS